MICLRPIYSLLNQTDLQTELNSGLTSQRPNQQKIGHFRNILLSQSRGLVVKNKTKQNKSKKQKVKNCFIPIHTIEMCKLVMDGFENSLKEHAGKKIMQSVL